jgi:hypothetical protein
VIKILKKSENALLEKISKSYFQPLFLLKLSQSNPILSFYIKKLKSVHYISLNKIKKQVFAKKLLRCFKTFKTKSFENFQIFFFTVYMMHHAIVGGNFMPIGEDSSTAKNRQK